MKIYAITTDDVLLCSDVVYAHWVGVFIENATNRVLDMILYKLKLWTAFTSGTPLWIIRYISGIFRTFNVKFSE